MSEMLEGVTWFKRSSVRVRRDGVEIHVDPSGVAGGSEANYILLTHPHWDTFSESDIDLVRGPNTVVLAPASMKAQISNADHYMKPGDLLHLEGVDVLAVPAYNRDKKFHPIENGWLGYVFTVGNVTYYHAGDTDLLDAMYGIRCNVAFLPCEGQYTMGPEEAAEAAQACGAEVVVPIHWGDDQPGGREVAEKMAEILPERVRILDPDEIRH